MPFFCCFCLFRVSPAQIIMDQEWGLLLALALGGLSVLGEPDLATFGDVLSRVILLFRS